ncbi:MAG: 50S ribosomal protein L25 [Ardenticatenaceae bacterium]|nr:50S ribosomal protein L25 [Ardenticatenaceae bacterium]
MAEERYTLEAEPRVIVGKKVKQLRRDGWTPAVIYSSKQEPLNIQLETRPLYRTLRKASTTHLIDVNVSGKKHTVLAREIQQHVTRGDLVHVDFLEVDMKANISAEVELVGIGEAPPETDGMGVVTLVTRSVTIECLPEDLISQIEVDLTKIQTPDDVITVADLVAPQGVTILAEPETIVASFTYERAALEEEEEEEEELYAPMADSVEVIGKGKKEEEFEE